MNHIHSERLSVAYLPLQDITPYDNNPRKHPKKQIQNLANCIGQLGFNTPILIDKNNVIVAGHARYQASQVLKLKEIPVIRLDGLNSEQVKAFRLSDNKIAEAASWDIDALVLELESLSELCIDFDLTFTGFETAEIDVLLAEAELNETFEEHVSIRNEPVTKLGDLWILGNHRIICSDSTAGDTYKDLLDDELADIVIADPPYNVPIQGHVLRDNKHCHAEFSMASGEMTDQEFESFNSNYIAHLKNFSSNGSIHYIFMNWQNLLPLLKAGQSYSELKNICIWNKDNGGMGSLYRSKHEMVCVFKNGDAPHVNNIELGKHGRYRTNVWDYPGQTSLHRNRDEELKMHPTVKPLKLIMDAICDCSERNSIVLDPFGGSGTTLMAAEQCRRRARLIEIDPRYVDVTIQRWQKLTGQQAVLTSSGTSFDSLGKSKNV